MAPVSKKHCGSVSNNDWTTCLVWWLGFKSGTDQSNNDVYLRKSHAPLGRVSQQNEGYIKFLIIEWEGKGVSPRARDSHLLWGYLQIQGVL